MAKYRDQDRYVITGMGIASPVGNDLETVRQNVMGGKHGIVNVRDTLFAGYDSLPIHVAAPVPDFNLALDPSFTEYKGDIRGKWDLSQQFILWAGAQALRQAGLSSVEHLRVEDHGLDPSRFGIYVGTGVGGVNTLADVRALLENEKARFEQAVAEGDAETIERLLESTRINPKSILKALPGRVAGTPSLIFGAKAGWKGILQECASGNGAIITGIEAIKLGKADVVLAGGVEGDITPVTAGAFGAARAVSRNKDPETTARQFDIARDGLTMGQGAGALVIERWDHALERGAVPLAEIVGYAENSDAKDETEPDPVNVVRCLNAALAMLDTPTGKLRGVEVNTHSTSTPVGDSAEIRAIKGALRADQISAITAPKSYTGHTFGGGGVIEAILSVQDLQENKAPRVLNLENPDPSTAGYDHLMHGSVDDIDVVVNSSFGFGGNNAVTVIGPPR
jgi:3-oxoacyl-[acyl-carrier-protein] synthase II